MKASALLPSLSLLLLAACSEPEPECLPKDKFEVFNDADGDGYGAPGASRMQCSVNTNQTRTPGDCDDSRSDVNPLGQELCNGVDDDCDGRVDEFFLTLPFFVDDDGDGWGALDIAPIHACLPQVGYTDLVGDCDDGNPGVSPAGAEICNGVDDDCDGRLDDEDPSVDPSGLSTWYRDADGDGYGDPSVVFNLCATIPGVVDNDLDCNDGQAAANPDAIEVCNGADDDCDGLRDDDDPGVDPTSFRTWFLDGDGDGFGDPATVVEQCQQPAGYIANGEDCDDGDDQIRGPTDWLADSDGDGYGVAPPLVADCVSPGAYHAPASAGLDCDDGNPAVSPGAPEICNGFDDNCDNRIDDNDPLVDVYATGTDFYPDVDGDGHGSDSVAIRACNQPPGSAPTNLDCDDGDPAVNPDAPEVCNGGIDDDCNTLADDADPGLDPTTLAIWYEDIDLDGHGTTNATVAACEAPAGYAAAPDDCNDLDPFEGAPQLWLLDSDLDGVSNGSTLWPGGPQCQQPALDYASLDAGVDCDDADPNRFPGNPEICADGVDQDCSGAEDCTLLAEDWESGAIDPGLWTASGDAMLTATPAIGAWALSLGGAISTVDSLPIDTTGCVSLDLALWVKRGPQAPGGMDSLTVAWWDGLGWQSLRVLPGNGLVDPDFLVVEDSLSDPLAMHPDFALRIESFSPAGLVRPFYVDDLSLTCH